MSDGPVIDQLRRLSDDNLAAVAAGASEGASGGNLTDTYKDLGELAAQVIRERLQTKLIRKLIAEHHQFTKALSQFTT